MQQKTEEMRLFYSVFLFSDLLPFFTFYIFYCMKKFILINRYIYILNIIIIITLLTKLLLIIVYTSASIVFYFSLFFNQLQILCISIMEIPFSIMEILLPLWNYYLHYRSTINMVEMVQFMEVLSFTKVKHIM